LILAALPGGRYKKENQPALAPRGTPVPLRLALCVLPLLAAAPARAAVDEAFFKDRVAPLLAQRCLTCHHGPKARGGLDLSTRAALLKGGDSGPALDRDRPADSVLLDVLAGPKPRMPKTGDPLTAAQVADLRRWAEGGAPWPPGLTLKPEIPRPTLDWWSLKPVVRPDVPAVKDARKVRNPIDAFLLARLEAAGLTFTPEADRRTLIRRLTFDLHGLPPTPEEIDDFLRDDRPDAYERLVDRLLASPRYGERWARHWLDVACYADTHGYDKDKRRPNAWPYRDYVIRSLNDDKPWGRFVTEQLAGDALAPYDPDALAAVGFLAAGPWDFVGHVELREGTVEKEKTRLLDRDDMVSRAVGAFCSLTVHCARCHDHKFDPIPQKDYYRLQAIFAGVERGDRTALAAEASPRTALERRRTELTRALTPAEPSPSNGWHSGIERSADVVKWVQVDLGKSTAIDAVRLIPARPTDFRDTPGFGFPARFKVEASDDPTFARAETLADHTRDDFANPGDRAVSVDGGGKAARYVRVTASRLWKRLDDYVFALAELEVDSGGKNAARGAAVTALDSIEAGRWGKARLTDGYDSRRALAPKARDGAEADRLRAALAEVEARLAKLPARVVYTVSPIAPRTIRVLRRGDVEQPGEEVGPGALSCVAGLEAEFKLADPKDEGARRAALAVWITDPKNPLTRRSVVNRLWQHHFGKGIVDTPSDFGRNGGRPSHPELLDWLADEFGKRGESLKAMHRLMVTSTAYRQQSKHDAKAAALDADNRLLWRMSRSRLDAESVRDAVLAVSGKLDRRMGGPGFEAFRFKDDHSPIYDHEDLERIHDPATHRRTVYRFTVRSVPSPLIDCLDGADPNASTPVRNSTLTALQALALLNDPFLVRQSEHFAERLQKLSDERGRQIEAAYRLAFGRPPSAAERDALAAYAKKHGLANACRLLFNANEFVFVD
jgi:hypothetical protein